MRKRKVNVDNISKYAMALTGRMYDTLKVSCMEHIFPCHLYLFDDIFHDTIIYVVQERKVSDMKTDGELMNHFIYRFKMIAFHTIRDIQQLKETNYADNKQTKEEKEQ
jgi:hypothetical protein